MFLGSSCFLVSKAGKKNTSYPEIFFLRIDGLNLRHLTTDYWLHTYETASMNTVLAQVYTG